MWKIYEQCFSHCLPVLSFTVSTIDKNLLSELWLELPDHRLGHLGTVSPSTGSSDFNQNQAHDTDGYKQSKSRFHEDGIFV